MVAFDARWDRLGSGALPAVPIEGELIEELDVSDLESEAAHEVSMRGSSERDNQVVELDGIADGGRFERSKDRFTLRLPRGRPVRVVARVGFAAAKEQVEGAEPDDEPVILSVRFDDRDAGTILAPAARWTEATIDVPSTVVARDRTVIEVVAPARAVFASFYYWFYGRANHE